MFDLPVREVSLWYEEQTGEPFPELRGDVEVAVAVVGGGITGLSAAYLLKQAGLRVAVVEMRRVGSGTSGRTTSKVTSQHNLVYGQLADQHGERVARLYGQANQAAVELVRQIVTQENLREIWQSEDNYVFTADPAQVKAFRQEAKLAAKLGLPASFENETSLPFAVSAAVKFGNQGRIHPLPYLQALARAVHGNGSYVFENSSVIGIRDGQPARLRSRRGTIYAQDIIVATNVPTLPLVARGGYCALEYPTESYIVAGKLPRKFSGMYISPDSRHYSILPVHHGGERLLLIGGESNISGVRTGKEVKYRRLAAYAQQNFGIQEFTHKWSDRDYQAYDGLPLAGKLYPWSKHVYVATAFRKWGLSNGTAAAIILRDLITGQSNPWAEIFNPVRAGPIKYIPKVAWKYISGKSHI